jgi:voltage-gated potassium channel
MDIKAIRHFFFRVLEGPPEYFWARIWMASLSIIILTNVVCIVLESVPSFFWAEYIFRFVENFSLTVFSIEYFLRIWVSPLSPKFKSLWNTLFQTVLVLYLIILTPFWFSWIIPYSFPVEILVMFRIFRILLFKSYFATLHQLFGLVKKHRTTLWNVFLLILSTLLMASTAMYHAEHVVQPDKFESILHAFYWAIVTFATIGYGDIVPLTITGKIITSLIAMMGVLLYSLPTYIIGSAFYEEIKSDQAREIERLRETVKALEAEKKLRESFLASSHHVMEGSDAKLPGRIDVL